MTLRVGLVAVLTATNSFAPVYQRLVRPVVGAAMVDALKARQRPIPPVLRAFAAVMDATGPWHPVPIGAVEVPPSGPLATQAFESLAAGIFEAVQAAGPVNAVVAFFGNAFHGAADDDGIGYLLDGMRHRLGPDVVIVAGIGRDAGISDRALAAANAVLPALATPAATAEEMALFLRLAAGRLIEPATEMVRLPLAWSRAGAARDRLEALGAEVEGRAARTDVVWRAGLIGGLPADDSRHAGVAVLVTGRRPDRSLAALAKELADHVWQRREGCETQLLPLSAAVALARTEATGRSVVIDSGDRIDEGAAGRSTDLVGALLWGGAPSVLSLGHVDPALVRLAFEAGAGAAIRAVFNTDVDDPAAGWLEVPADVIGVGGTAGQPTALAAIRSDTVTMVVSAAPLLHWDPPTLAGLGLDCDSARTIVTKFGLDRMTAALRSKLPPTRHDVDTNALGRLDDGEKWRRRPRPFYPLDRDCTWPPLAGS